MRSNDIDSCAEGGSSQEDFTLFILRKGVWGFGKVLVFRKMNATYCISNGRCLRIIVIVMRPCKAFGHNCVFLFMRGQTPFLY